MYLPGRVLMTEIQDTRDKPRINWYRSPIDKDVLKELTQRSDAKAFLHIGLMFALLLITGAGTYYAWTQQAWIWVVLGCYVHATFWTFLSPSAASHELSHLSVFKTPGLNRFFARLIGFLSWTDFVGFRASHLWHHKLTCYQERDLEVVLPQTYTWQNWLSSIFFNPKFLWDRVKLSVRQCRGIIRGPWPKWIFRDPAVLRERTIWARIIFFGHLALAALFILSGQWIFIFLFTLPSFYANWLGTLIGFTQHAGMQPNVPDHRFSCRSVDMNPFFRFLYWNMNYHVEHHMYAGVPFYNLPKLRKAIESDLPPMTPGVIAAWRDIYDAQKKREEDPNYHITAQLPETAHPAQMAA
jgi:fatty acid desaturase